MTITFPSGIDHPAMPIIIQPDPMPIGTVLGNTLQGGGGSGSRGMISLLAAEAAEAEEHG